MKTLLNRLIPGREAPSNPRSTLLSETDRDAAHREIAAMALRDVLRKFGIPLTWITANPQVSTNARRERGVHLHLMVRDWQPQLLIFLVAIERQVRSRVLRLDPFSADWLTGVSWKFDLVDESSCPALPESDFWRQSLDSVPAQSAREGDRSLQPPVRAPSRAQEELPVLDRALDREPAFVPTQPMAH